MNKRAKCKTKTKDFGFVSKKEAHPTTGAPLFMFVGEGQALESPSFPFIFGLLHYYLLATYDIDAVGQLAHAVGGAYAYPLKGINGI